MAAEFNVFINDDKIEVEEGTRYIELAKKYQKDY